MRTSGILMHISSLPSDYGIGTFGKEAFRFIDFLKKAGQTYWQILPICPTSYGDSPYQSFSAYAINPYFIDLELLEKENLLERNEFTEIKWFVTPFEVDYEILYNNRYKVLKKAYRRFESNIPKEYNEFCKKNSFWLDDYSLFMALKDSFDGKSFSKWSKKIVERDENAIAQASFDCEDSISFYKFLQYYAFKQWFELKEYANENGVKIIGDMPIYVAADSADVWARPDQFFLDDEFQPVEVAGCPPDGFTPDGQLWGNPLYNWDVMKKDEYKWWCERISFTCKIYDVVRIDHFRGFESYFCIPNGDKNAKKGKWRKGPGIDLFNCFKKKFGNLPIIAEDLGFLTPDVVEMLKETGFPGMKVLQFAFDEEDNDNEYLPHNITKNSIVYTGTHDNDTIVGWSKSMPKSTVEFAKRYMRITDNEGINWGMMKTAWASSADTAIITMQDFMGLDSTARMNTPSKLGGNWLWRIEGGCINDWLAKIIYENTKLYLRLPK